MSRAFSIAFIFFLTSLAVAQDAGRYSEQAENSFQEGLEFFKSNEFEGAYAKFSDVIRVQTRNQRTTAAYLMGAKALYRLHRYEESVQLLKNFLRLFPQSKYLSDGHFTLGTNYYLRHRYEDAVSEFLNVLEHSQEKSLVEKSESLLNAISEEHLDIKILQRFSQIATTPKTKFLLGLKLAEKQASGGRTDDARAVLAPLLQRYPDVVYAAPARDLLRKFERKLPVKIGVVLPLFNDSSDPSSKEIGQEILRGIEFAVDEFRISSGTQVDLKVLDSEGDSSKAADAVRKLSMDEDIAAILGPIYSAEVAASGKVASDHGVPLISPTANANGLALIGRSVFQANPDYRLRGKAMARYAVERLGLKTFTILAPSDSYGKFIAEGFLDEVGRLGAKVIGTEWYQQGATEFKDQLTRLRMAGRLEVAATVVSFARKISPTEIKRLTARGVHRELLDSLIARKEKINVEVLLGKEGKRIADSLHIPTMKDVPEVDSLEIPVTAIDGFYVPIASFEGIGILSAQLAYYNFKSQLLGSGDWYNPVELDANRRYTDGVIFDSDTFVDPSDSSYLKFFDGFYQSKNMRPTKNTLFGYDAARLLLTVLSKGPATRERILAALQRVRDFRGLHSKISFNRGRVNSALNILRYKAGEVRKIDEMILQDN